MRRQIAISFILALTVLAGGTFVFRGQAALAMQLGEEVTFLLPLDGNQAEPNPPSPITDKIVYTGGRIVSVDTSGCAAGSHPLQQAVLVDPGGVRASRTVYLITISQTDAASPGTRLTNLISVTQCAIQGREYNKYRGWVE